jgi:hypothetical protein
MRKLNCALLIIALGLPLSLPAAEDVWHLLVEPSFMPHEAAWPIPGTKTSVLVPSRLEEGEVLPLQRDEVVPRQVTRAGILASARSSASEVLKRLTPRYVRDSNQVIQYAVLESNDPLMTSAVLAPEFSGRFAETLGPEIVVAIPNHSRIFVFPRLSLAHQNFSDLIFVEYQSTPYPVSRDLFALRNGKLIAIGSPR